MCNFSTIAFDTNFCVTGTAILKKDETEEFKKTMKEFERKVTKQGIHIQTSKILLQAT